MAALASAIAKLLAAGRYVLREVSRSGDSATRGLPCRILDQPLLGEPAPSSLPGSWYRPTCFVSSPTVRSSDDWIAAGGTSLGGSASLPAVEAFARGGEVIGRWKLTQAEQAFADALRYDASYRRRRSGWPWCAAGWMRRWRRGRRWRCGAAPSPSGFRCATGIASALLARSAGDMASSCARWRELGMGYPNDFVPKYGLADRLANDNTVVRDASAARGDASGKPGRGERGLRPCVRALAPIYKSLKADAPASVRTVYQARRALQRVGHAAPPDTGQSLLRRGSG